MVVAPPSNGLDDVEPRPVTAVGASIRHVLGSVLVRDAPFGGVSRSKTTDDRQQTTDDRQQTASFMSPTGVDDDQGKLRPGWVYSVATPELPEESAV